MPPRILLIYATVEGHTRKVAGVMAATLRHAGADVTVVNARRARPEPRPEDYDAVIVAAPVRWSGRYQRAVRRWVRTHAENLRRLPTAFVSVCLAVANGSLSFDRWVDEALARFREVTRWSPSESKVVAGALPYLRYHWLKREVIRRLVARRGGDADATRNHEYTDWDDLIAFALRFLGSIEVHQLARLAVR